MKFLNWMFWLVVFSYSAMFVTYMGWIDLNPTRFVGMLAHLLIIGVSFGLAYRFNWPIKAMKRN